MIVPEGSGLQATLLAPSRSAGFLKAGQDVNLLVDAFPYQKFGVQKGIIKDISATPYRPGELDLKIRLEKRILGNEIYRDWRKRKIHFNNGLSMA